MRSSQPRLRLLLPLVFVGLLVAPGALAGTLTINYGIDVTGGGGITFGPNGFITIVGQSPDGMSWSNPASLSIPTLFVSGTPLEVVSFPGTVPSAAGTGGVLLVNINVGASLNTLSTQYSIATGSGPMNLTIFAPGGPGLGSLSGFIAISGVGLYLTPTGYTAAVTLSGFFNFTGTEIDREFELPEPASGGLIGVGLAALGTGMLARRRRSARESR